MHIEALGLEAGEAVGNGLESGAHGLQMIGSFLQPEVAQVVGAQLVAQEAGEFFLLFEESVFPIGAQDVMAVFKLIEDSGQLSS